MSVESGTQSPLMTIKAAGTWHFGLSSAITVDSLAAVEKQSGEVPTPTPAEVDLAVAALASSVCAAVPTVAEEMGFWHSGIDFQGQARFSVESSVGAGSPVRRFEAVSGTVSVRTDETQERVDELGAEVQRRCHAFRLLDQAGITPDIRWRRAAPDR